MYRDTDACNAVFLSTLQPLLTIVLLALPLWASTVGCAATRLSAPSMPPLAELSGAPLAANHFHRDRGNLSEDAIRSILAAPVFLEGHTRIGVVQVAESYEPNSEVSTLDITRSLGLALEETGLFELATEMTTDWPTDRGTAGLRELAARYRCEYLLLYRHRFAERSEANHFSWLFLTVVGIFAAPSQTVQTAGVLEATLFDVKTGTLLFTVFERVHDEAYADPFSVKSTARRLQEKLVSKAGSALAGQVVAQTRRLAAAPGGPNGDPLPPTRLSQRSYEAPPTQ